MAVALRRQFGFTDFLIQLHLEFNPSVKGCCCVSLMELLLAKLEICIATLSCTCTPGLRSQTNHDPYKVAGHYINVPCYVIQLKCKYVEIRIQIKVVLLYIIANLLILSLSTRPF
jgi:hypothetical protein